MLATPEKLAVLPEEALPHPCISNADAVPLELTLIDPAHPQRACTEAFVRSIFARAYGARLDIFYPVLLRITRPDGSYAAVAGVRRANEQALFSEHYLKQPADKILCTKRSGIVEVGNLAPASIGQARWLIGTLTAFLTGAGFSNVVFTAVPRLRNAFSRMGLPLTRLAEARSDCLPDDLAEDWGSYYESDPAVYSSDLRLGFRAFTQLMAIHPNLRDILQQAYKAGKAFTNIRVPEDR